MSVVAFADIIKNY